MLEVRPTVAVPTSQAWFWTEDRQRREREVDEHLEAGHAVDFADADELIDHLDTLRDDVADEAASPRRR